METTCQSSPTHDPWCSPICKSKLRRACCERNLLLFLALPILTSIVHIVLLLLLCCRCVWLVLLWKNLLLFLALLYFDRFCAHCVHSAWMQLLWESAVSSVLKQRLRKSRISATASPGIFKKELLFQELWKGKSLSELAILFFNVGLTVWVWIGWEEG